ncbi:MULTISPECIES: GNAT family N-acetyltransferase [Acinetobacter]|uniref:GNAT family N-acetyltransferase n=1 Tax=Acinetobacter TaxID=469 RepID=UPI001AEA1568|nr:GNAT family N-acetyltransferase [Acinetobacter nosocomialis]MBP1472634.1 hypothetical protein [Acinetobacter nosocomialis]
MQLSVIIGALIFFTILLVVAIDFSVRVNKKNNSKTDLIRDAKVEDIEFIYNNVLEGSRNGYFHPDLYNVKNARLGLKKNIRTIIEKNYRLDSNEPDSWAFIYEKNGLPVSVLILSRSSTQGFEIWIMATEKEYQNNGYAKELLLFILNNFKNKNTIIEAQCYIKSEIMMKMLKDRGFEQVKNNNQNKNLYRIMYRD